MGAPTRNPRARRILIHVPAGATADNVNRGSRLVKRRTPAPDPHSNPSLRTPVLCCRETEFHGQRQEWAKNGGADRRLRQRRSDRVPPPPHSITLWWLVQVRPAPNRALLERTPKSCCAEQTQ